MNLKFIAADPSSPAHFDDPRRGLITSPNHNGHNGHEHHDHDGGDHHVHVDHHPRIFGSADHQASDGMLEVLGAELKDADLAAPPVVLPDFYHKHNMEMPSSIAAHRRFSSFRTRFKYDL